MLLFILPLFSGGGAERVTINILLQLHSRGHSVGLIVFSKKGPLLEMIPDDITIYDLGTERLRRSIVPLLLTIYRLRPKVIFSTFGYINISLIFFRWLMPKKTEIWIREANLPSISLVHNKYPHFMRFAYYWLYNSSNKLISTSERMSEEFNINFNIPLSKISLLPNPVDEEKIRSSIKPFKYKESDGFNFVAAGRLTYQKGFDRLLFWFANLKDDSNTLTILGEGPLHNELKSTINVLGIQNQVTLMGFVQNPWHYYAYADAFLLLSRWEGMPNVVLEALTCGTMVIATADSGGIKEVKKQTLDGSVFIIENEKEFIQTVRCEISRKKTSINASLLPVKYQMKNVVSIIEGWLKEIG